MSTAGLELSGVDAGLESRLRERMQEVEQRLAAAVRSDTPFIDEAARHLLRAGGKRLRPQLVLLAAEFGEDPDASGVLDAALVVELTHLATLYHDDVIDEAQLRRGALSANARWDNTVAILTGDYLFARASDLVADLGPEAVGIQARTFARLVQGQIREAVGPQPGEDPLQHYLSVLTDKTGSLIATSAHLGALVSGTPQPVQQTLTEFGERIGMAFQLSDDVLDVAGEPGTFGKRPGTDLREGVATLPVLVARRSNDPADARLLRLLGSDLSDDARHAEALELLRRHPALEEARAEVTRRVEAARALLAALPAGPGRSGLAAMCDLVATRTV